MTLITLTLTREQAVLLQQIASDHTARLARFVEDWPGTAHTTRLHAAALDALSALDEALTRGYSPPRLVG